MSVRQSKRELLRMMLEPAQTQDQEKPLPHREAQESKQRGEGTSIQTERETQTPDPAVQPVTAQPQDEDSQAGTIPFPIQPKQKKQPKAVTHTRITTEIYTPLLEEFDNIASHLDYSRAELLEEVMRNFVGLVKKTHPEWAEKPLPRKKRGRK